ncbi:MAG: Gfo/Idh/MocA family oxidoreductase [Clostridia bacterium]|nr:Gfo/Idh/MocA family oxidoreductase [Clostridia bacterium]
MHKLGIIGFGGMAEGYHYATTKRDDIDMETVAVYDINPDRLAHAEELGLKACKTLDEFLSEHYDLVVVATANNYHCQMACAALEAGNNVMTEKPTAMSSAEVETMIETAKKCGKFYTVHQNRRWDRDFMIVKKAFDDGVLKLPYMIESRIQGDGGSMTGWRSQPDHGGGMFLDWGIHAMDQMLYLIQEPVKTVTAVVRNITTTLVDDYAKVLLTFESGLAAEVEVSTFILKKLPRWSVFCKDGALQVDEISSQYGSLRKVTKCEYQPYDLLAYTDLGVVHRTDKKLVYESETCQYPDIALPQDWAVLYKNLINVIDGKEELIVKPEQVLRCYKVMEAAFRSSREGVTVNFDDRYLSEYKKLGE